MALQWTACCCVRDTDFNERGPLLSFEEEVFYDCIETPRELVHGREDLASTRVVLESTREALAGRPDFRGDPAARDCMVDLAKARAVLESTREEWSRRVMDLRTKAGPELEWATLPTARRFLKANIGDVQKAVKMFLEALEVRARDRQLFQTLHCEAHSDLRILGRDLDGLPVVYMCCRSQTAPLGSVRDQLIVTLEKACKLTTEMGTVAFIVDMHGLQPHLIADIKAIKDLANVFGTVYAERICRITIVDFPLAARAVWWMVKPIFSEVTRQKFAFVSHAQALELCQRQLTDRLYMCLRRTFEVNRDPNSTPEERAMHAHCTSMCETQLGSAAL